MLRRMLKALFKQCLRKYELLKCDISVTLSDMHILRIFITIFDVQISNLPK